MPTITKTTAAKSANNAKAKAPRAISAKQQQAIAKRKAEADARAKAIAETITSERLTASALINALDANRVSVPVKSVTAYGKRYNKTVTAHPAGRKPSLRQAAALAVAALANGKRVADKATFARTFDHAGGRFTIENGALSDAIASGLCSYNADAETITILNAAEIAAHVGTVTKLAA